ncbi:MAG: hypothetical protein NC342_04315 [Pseudoflavonifractor sp.]|nr:hypothetical protein [Alloprevotella sp.]MCM1116741.1 hypothetical protein [Pseudoflavonifractor sp.]
MTTVQRHIQYLAATSDCVIIPGWGGLIAAHTPAALTGGCLTPPKRSLVFNPALCHDDGLLARSLARREKISYEAAKMEIAAEVGSMRSQYETVGALTLPRIGAFRRLDDGTMLFTSAADSIANARYEYLQPLALNTAGNLDDSSSESEAAEVHIMTRESLGRRILRVAALVAIVLGLALTLSTPISVNFKSRPDFASVGAIPPPAPQPSLNAPMTHTMVIVVPDSTLAVAPVVAKPAQETKAKYYLIIGSFASRGEAERWMETRPESSLGIIERNGRFRVYAATGQSIEEAMALKANPDFAKRNPEAWVYLKR